MICLSEELLSLREIIGTVSDKLDEIQEKVSLAEDEDELLSLGNESADLNEILDYLNDAVCLMETYDN